MSDTISSSSGDKSGLSILTQRLLVIIENNT